MKRFFLLDLPQEEGFSPSSFEGPEIDVGTFSRNRPIWPPAGEVIRPMISSMSLLNLWVFPCGFPATPEAPGGTIPGGLFPMEANGGTTGMPSRSESFRASIWTPFL